jgi:hypothetical protein
MWNTTQQNEDTKTFVSCNGNKIDITGISGLGLVEKLKSVARNENISKFDIFDEENKNLSPSDIENGNFNGDLTITRFNVAAA